MKSRFRFAVAAAAAAGVASAQQVQVQFAKPVQLVEPAYPTTPPKPTKPADTEFKLPANTSPDPKSLAVPDDLHQKAKALAANLSSPLYAERHLATKKLAELGRMALPALQEVATTSDQMEAVQRAEGLIGKAEAEDMKARVACFLADTKGEFNHILPGWEKFKAVAGNDKSTRELFAEALKSNTTHQMLLAADKSADDVNTVMNQYMTKLVNHQNGNGGRFGGGGWDDGGKTGAPFAPKLADVVIALFLEGQFSDKDVLIQPQLPWGWGGGGYYSVANYLYSVPDVQSAIYSNGSGKHAPAIRKIMVQWMDTRESTQGANQAYQIAQSLFGNSGKPEDRKKPLKYAAKVLEGEGGMNNYWMKLNILTQFGQQGAKEYLPSIVKCFDDSTVFWQAQNQNPAFDIQVRDMALATAVQLTDQKPEDYGFTRTPGHGAAKEKNWNQNAFHFTDDVNKTPANPNGGGFRGGKIRQPVDPKAEDPKKEEPKKEEPKDPKEPKKLTQDDRRKAAFAKWEEWSKENGKKDAKDPKAPEPKKDGQPTPADPKKPAEPAPQPVVEQPMKR